MEGDKLNTRHAEQIATNNETWEKEPEKIEPNWNAEEKADDRNDQLTKNPGHERDRGDT